MKEQNHSLKLTLIGIILIAVIVAFSLFLFSCNYNETCRDKTFQDANWQRENPSTLYNNLQFRGDDTLTYDMPGLGFYGLKSKYQFDNDCAGFTWEYPFIDTTLYYSITKNTGDTIEIKCGTNNYKYIRQ